MRGVPPTGELIGKGGFGQLRVMCVSKGKGERKMNEKRGLRPLKIIYFKQRKTSALTIPNNRPSDAAGTSSASALQNPSVVQS